METTVVDYKKQAKDLYKHLIEELKSAGLEESVEVIRKTSNVVSKRHQSSWSNEVMHHITCTSSIDNKAKLDEIYKKVQIPGRCNYLVDFSIKVHAGMGEKFFAVKGFEDVFTNKEDVILEHSAGETLLIDLWSSTSQPCLAQMQINSQLLEANKKSNFRIVGVSLEENKNNLVQTVIQKSWKSIQHLKLTVPSKDHDLMKLYEVPGIPFVILIGPSGRIDYLGHPGKVNLQERILKLSQLTIEQDEQRWKEEATKKKKESEQSQVASRAQSITKEQYHQVREFLKVEFYQKVCEKFSNFKGRFGVILTKQSTYQKENTNKSLNKQYNKPIIDFVIEKADEKQTKELLENIRDKYGKEMFLVGIQSVSDQKSTIIMHLKDLSNVLNELNITSFRFSLRRDLVLILAKNQVLIKQRGEEITQQGEMTPVQIPSADLQKVRARFRFYGDMLFKEKRNFDVVKKLLAMGPQISLKGTRFFPMQEMYLLDKKDKTVQLSHTPGEVLIIDFFLFKLQPCVEKINEYKELWKANQEKWQGKVKFVAACVEPLNEKSLAVHSQNNWGEFMEFFCFKQDLRFRDEFMHYRIQQMPHVCVVDKFGAIAFNGEVKNVNLSETISSLIEANVAVSNEAQSQLDGNQQKANYYAAKKLVQSGLAHPAFACIAALTYDPRLIIKVTREKVFNTKGEVIEKIYKKPEIGFGIKKEDDHVIDEFFKSIDKSNFKVDVEYLENV